MNPLWRLGEPPDYKPMPANSEALIVDLELENAALRQALASVTTDKLIVEARLNRFMEQWKNYGWVRNDGK